MYKNKRVIRDNIIIEFLQWNQVIPIRFSIKSCIEQSRSGHPHMCITLFSVTVLSFV